MPENNHKIEEDLVVFKEYIAKQPHLPQNIDDRLLLRFLHTCNFSVEQAKNLLDLFFTVRQQAPEIFGNRDPSSPEIQQVFNVTDMVPLPKPTANNYKLFIYRLSDPDPDKYNYVNSLRTFFIVSDIRMLLEEEIFDGEIPIFDAKGLSLRHLTKVSLPIMKKYMYYTQEAHPIRLKQIHIINAPSIIDKCLSLIKPFMKNEVASMLHFHVANSETLFEYIPRELLPEEYGGPIGKLEKYKKEWIDKVMANKDYFLDESRWTLDESKRPTDNPNRKNIASLQGTFRSLSID